MAAIKAHCPAVAAATGPNQLRPGNVTTVLPMKTAEDLEVWQKLDDVIMVCLWVLLLLLSVQRISCWGF